MHACIEMGYERYKFIVQVIIGEQRGEGVKYVVHCIIIELNE